MSLLLLNGKMPFPLLSGKMPLPLSAKSEARQPKPFQIPHTMRKHLINHCEAREQYRQNLTPETCVAQRSIDSFFIASGAERSEAKHNSLALF